VLSDAQRATILDQFDGCNTHGWAAP
jgi:hypothetical protein